MTVEIGTIRERARQVNKREQPTPPLRHLPELPHHPPEDTTQTRGTIGARARQRSLALAGRETVDTPLPSRSTTTASHASEVAREETPPPRAKYVSRHSAEYIREQGATPLSIDDIRAKRVQRTTDAAPEPEPAGLPNRPSTTPLGPRRVPFTALRAEIPDFETSIPLAEPAEFDYSPSEPAPEPPPLAAEPVSPLRISHSLPKSRARGRASVPESARFAVAPEPLVTSHATARRLASAGFASSAEPTSTPPERRSATQEGIHERRGRRGSRRLVAAAAAVTLLGGLVGGFALWKKNTDSPAHHDQKPIELALPEVPSQIDTDPPFTAVSLSEPETISPQDPDAWGHSANKTSKTLGRDYAITGDTNIVKDLTAEASLGTIPDLDAAKPGDTIMTPTAPVISLIDTLRDGPGENATPAEKDAAQIIYTLNHLGPMETKALIQQYGSQIEQLEADITAILTPAGEMNQDVTPASYAPEAVSESHTVITKPKIFAGLAQKATSIFHRDPMKKAEKATAALTKDRLRRQRQPSFA